MANGDGTVWLIIRLFGSPEHLQFTSESTIGSIPPLGSFLLPPLASLPFHLCPFPANFYLSLAFTLSPPPPSFPSRRFSSVPAYRSTNATISSIDKSREILRFHFPEIAVSRPMRWPRIQVREDLFLIVDTRRETRITKKNCFRNARSKLASHFPTTSIPSDPINRVGIVYLEIMTTSGISGSANYRRRRREFCNYRRHLGERSNYKRRIILQIARPLTKRSRDVRSKER